MDAIKSFIKDGIVEEMNIKIKSYEEQIEQVEEENNIPRLYQMLVEIYHNHSPQREVAESFLRKALKNEFFNRSNVITKMNELRFQDDEYYVSFPTSRNKTINIVDLNLDNEPYFQKVNIESRIKLIELIEKFLSKKNISNLKSLNDYLNRNNKPKSVIENLYNYYSTYKTYNNSKLEELKGQILSYEKRKKDYKEKLEEYNKGKKEALEFAYSLKELEDWHKAGWRIVLSSGGQLYK